MMTWNLRISGCFALSLCGLALHSSQAETYYGPLWNVDYSGWGLPGGSLELTHDSTTVYGKYTKGAGSFTDGLIIYIDSKAGGYNSTAELSDNSDYFRRSISLVHESGSFRCTANFAPGFGADYAIAMNCDLNGGRLYELVGGSGGVFLPNADGDPISVNLSPSNDQSARNYTFSFSWASIGLESVSNKGFLFETLRSVRTGWVYPDSLQETSGTEGWGNTITFSSVGSYGTVAVPEPSACTLLVLGLGAWMARRRL